MVSAISPTADDWILDPTSGTGGFLIDAHEAILCQEGDFSEVPVYGQKWLEDIGLKLKQAKQKYPNLQVVRKSKERSSAIRGNMSVGIAGIEISQQMIRIAAMNYLLRGMKSSALTWGNSADMVWHRTTTTEKPPNVILANPPFGGRNLDNIT